MWQSWLLAAAAVLGVLAVDRSNFKKCSDSSFCTRNRALTVVLVSHVPVLISAAWKLALFRGPVILVCDKGEGDL
jgi:hypothetical protein